MISCAVKLKLRPTQERMLTRWLWHMTGVYNWAVRKIELDAQREKENPQRFTANTADAIRRRYVNELRGLLIQEKLAVKAIGEYSDGYESGIQFALTELNKRFNPDGYPTTHEEASAVGRGVETTPPPQFPAGKIPHDWPTNERPHKYRQCRRCKLYQSDPAAKDGCIRSEPEFVQPLETREALAQRVTPLMREDLEHWRVFLLTSRQTAKGGVWAKVHIDHLTAAATCIGNLLKMLAEPAATVPARAARWQHEAWCATRRSINSGPVCDCRLAERTAQEGR